MADVGDLAELAVVYTGAGVDQFINVYGFRVKEAFTGTDLTGLASAFKTAVLHNGVGGVLYGARSDYGSSLIRARWVDPSTAAGIDYTFTRVVGTDGTSPALPYTNALVVKWTTGLSGRSYRGRTYLTGWSTVGQTAGVWTNTMITNVESFVTSMLGAFGPSGTDTNWEFVVISRVNAGTPRTTPVGTPITAGVVGSVVRQQRRREVGVGI